MPTFPTVAGRQRSGVAASTLDTQYTTHRRRTAQQGARPGPSVFTPVPEVTNLPGRAYFASSTHIPPRSSAPKCFRIANVPSDWNEVKLLKVLKQIDPFLEQILQLSLYPACCGPTKTALLNLGACTAYFQHLKSSDYNYITFEETLLVIDSHFFDLTPLNTPEEEIHAESVPHSLFAFAKR